MQILLVGSSCKKNDGSRSNFDPIQSDPDYSLDTQTKNNEDPDLPTYLLLSCVAL